MKKTLTITASLIATSLLISACGTSPTGRSQITLLSDSELNTMGTSSFEELKKKETISKDTRINRYVQCIADAITPHVDSSVHRGEWEVVVFESEQANAFALPGGKIGVYTGILNVADNQDQVAAVMGHEVAHVIAKHSNERVSSGMLAQTGMAVAGSLMKDYDPETQAMVMGGLGIGVQYGVLMPYGRTHESEADIIGQELMAKAGFNPKEAVSLWHNMAKLSSNHPPEFLSTHPSSQTRIKQLTEGLAKTEPIYQQTTKRPNCKV